MFILVVVTFAICWLPYHGYFIYMHIDKTVIYKKWIQHLYELIFIVCTNLHIRQRGHSCYYFQVSLLLFPRHVTVRDQPDYCHRHEQ